MPTNDERHEVAAKLRELETSRWYDGMDEVCALEDACGCGIGQDWQDMELKDRLAELIEPEPERTCRLRSRYTSIYCYECSECGKGMKPEWAYCPRCRAKVVEK